jgi:hypothetical protein
MVKIFKYTSKVYTELYLPLAKHQGTGLAGTVPSALASDGGDRSVSHPDHFIRGEGAPGTHCVGCCSAGETACFNDKGFDASFMC